MGEALRAGEAQPLDLNVIRRQHALGYGQCHVDELIVEIERLRDLIADAREACPSVRMQDHADAPLLELLGLEVGRGFNRDAEVARLAQEVERLRASSGSPEADARLAAAENRIDEWHRRYNVLADMLTERGFGDLLDKPELFHPASRSLETETRQTCWLIELPPSGTRYEAGKAVGPGEPTKWYGRDGIAHWTTDAMKAIRFARKEDAEACCGFLSLRVAFVSEHIFGLASRASAATKKQAKCNCGLGYPHLEGCAAMKEKI
jgi:hypothetical protein